MSITKVKNVISDSFSNKIYVLIFIGNIIILQSHCFPLDVIDTSNNWYKLISLLGQLTIPVMSYFFFTSGFLFFYNFDLNKTKYKLFSRFFSLVIPFLIWNLFAIVFVRLWDYIEFGIIDFSFVKLYELFIIHGEYGPLNDPLWYLFRLITYIYLAPFIYLGVKNKTIGFLFIIACVILNLLFKTNYLSFSYWLPMFMLGSWISIHYFKYINKTIPNFFLNTIVAKVLAIIVFIGLNWYILKVNSQQDNDIILYLYRLLSGIYIYFLLKFINFKPPSAMVKKLSFYIFVSQFLFLKVAKSVVSKLIDVNERGFYQFVAFIMIFILKSVMIFLSYLMIKTLSPKVLKILTGYRA